MPRGLNKQPPIFQPLCEEVIKVITLHWRFSSSQTNQSHRSQPTDNDCCAFTQDGLEPRYLKIFTLGNVAASDG